MEMLRSRVDTLAEEWSGLLRVGNPRSGWGFGLVSWVAYLAVAIHLFSHSMIGHPIESLVRERFARLN
jgi:hypothetical protein